jgi:hypothetical protein
MRPWLLCAALAVFIVSNAAAQTGTICLYADPQGTQCSLSDTAPGLLSVYVIHNPLSTPSGGALGVRFAAPRPDCMTGASWVSDSTPFSLSGSSQTGAGVTYGGCITEPTHILTIQYLVSGTTVSDCPYTVVPYIDEPMIGVVTCNLEGAQGVGGIAYVNSSLLCVCAEPTGPAVLAVSPTAIDFRSDGTQDFFYVINEGGGVLTWTAEKPTSWLSVSPTRGAAGAMVGLVVTRSGLPVGNYETDVVVNSSAGILPVHVFMEVAQALSVSPAGLMFEASQTEKVVQVRNVGPETLNWLITTDRPWLSALPAQGVDNQDVRVRVDRSGLAGGTYTGTLTVTAGAQAAQVAVWMWVDPAGGAAGTIGVFSDPQASGCNLFDQGPGLMTAYIVHVLTAGASASQFAAPVPSCMTGVSYLGESTVFPVTIGTTQRGVSIGYGACLSGTIHLLTVRFFGQGLTEPCCVYPVVPDPQEPTGEIGVIDCSHHYVVGAGTFAIVNPTPSCQCGSIKTEEATWGKIKSMYSDE